MFCSILEAEHQFLAEVQTIIGTHAVRHGALGLLEASAVPVERLRPAETKSGSGEHANPRCYYTVIILTTAIHSFSLHALLQFLFALPSATPTDALPAASGGSSPSPDGWDGHTELPGRRKQCVSIEWAVSGRRGRTSQIGSMWKPGACVRECVHRLRGHV